MHILAISGSLRAGASNTALLAAVARLAPPSVTVEFYESVAELPHFNPDLDSADGGELPPIVAELRAKVGRADALLFSTPEYAHGLPGAFKNVLDWLVGSTEFPGKLVAMICPSARSTYAQAQLREILRTMSAVLVEPACVVIPLPSRDMDTEAILAAPELAAALRSVLAEMAAAVSTGPVHFDGI